MEAIITILGLSSLSTLCVFISTKICIRDDIMEHVVIENKFTNHNIKNNNIDNVRKVTFNRIIEVIHIPSKYEYNKYDLWYNIKDLEKEYEESINK